MSEPRIAPTTLEEIYAELAQAVDRAGREREPLFLAKLALTLAAMLGDPVRVRTAVDMALSDLDRAPSR